jgi:FlaA1/EpsC-like NDP-sugar epimerase
VAAIDDRSAPLPPESASFFTGKKILVTGGGGSIGTELVEQLLALPVAYIRVIDNNETAIFNLSEHLRDSNRCEALYCDVRDEYEVNRTFSGMDYCFHAAALKHVPSCERSPFSAVQTNIIGTQQVIRAALRNHLSHVLITSSDKAVNPTNVMGTSKLMAERLFTAANSLSEGSHRCIFSSTRFGNVAGSQGSVIPLFCSQIRLGRDVTLTHSGMTRFIMTLADAGRLVIESMAWSLGGEIFITKMPVVAIKDLARVMVRLIAPCYGRKPAEVKMREIGPRPGEKIWEELNTDEEVRRTYDLGKYLVVLPALRGPYGNLEYVYRDHPLHLCEKIYHSANEPAMSDADIEELLLRPNVLPADLRHRLGFGCGEH